MNRKGMPVAHPLTNPLLRWGLGFFILLWGVDKLVATEGAQGIYSHFYFLDIGAGPVQLFGALEILLGAAIMLGLFRTLSYGLGLIAHSISTLASYELLLNPWAAGTPNHLFLAAIPVLAAFIVLFLNRQDSYLTLDARLARRPEAAAGG